MRRFILASCAASSLAFRPTALQAGPGTLSRMRPAPLFRNTLLSGVRMMCAEAAEGPSAYDLLDVRVGKIVEAWEHPDSVILT